VPEVRTCAASSFCVKVGEQLVNRYPEMGMFNLIFDEVGKLLLLLVTCICKAHVDDVDIANCRSSRITIRINPGLETSTVIPLSAVISWGQPMSAACAEDVKAMTSKVLAGQIRLIASFIRFILTPGSLNAKILATSAFDSASILRSS
jgi:hypothetical protein